MKCRPHTRHQPLARAAAIFSTVAVFVCGCSEDPPPKSTEDVAVTDTLHDTTSSTADATALIIPAGEHVGADLTKHLPSLAGSGAYVRPWKPSDKFTGSAAQSRLGDWVIGNASLRVAIQGPDRHISVCPWGGNPIDGSRMGDDGQWSDDEMGEQCLLFNLGRTLKPAHFEVLADGSEGGPAILAVTGTDTVLDFINLPSLLESFLGLGSDLPLDPNADVPVTITRYYILGAQDNAIRVVTAFRNDGAEALTLGTGELIDSGGEVEFFNPAAKSKGFGSAGGFGAEAMDFIAFTSPRGGHAYAPPLDGSKPGASYLAIGGAAGVLLGTNNLLPLLLGGPGAFAKSKAAVRVPAGTIVTRAHVMTVGTGELTSLSAPIWRARGATLQVVTGKVQTAAGLPVAGARVSALLGEAAHTQARTGSDGQFTLELPNVGAWRLQAFHPGHGLSELVAHKTGESATLLVADGGMLAVQVKGSDGAPRPAKVTVYCAKQCAAIPATSGDVNGDRPGEGVWRADFVPMSGKLQLALPVGGYRVVVTGGPTNSIWPADFATSGGHPVEIKPSKTVDVTATVREVVDTSGWLSADFHVHAVNSPDAAVENRRRVLSCLAEGLDVLVPTDHDYISELKPVIAAEKASARLTSLPGVEVTTFDYGHFNAFPLKHDGADLTGGAIDWGGGDGPGMDPPAIQKALRALGSDGPAVVQINHPGSYLSTIKVDILGGISLAPRAPFRVTEKKTDPKTGDTGLFTDDFTAIELITGHRGGGFGGGFGGDSFARNLNWWFALLSRGVRWTGTATSDTHSALRSQVGGSRSYVYMGAGKDKVDALDVKLFTQRVNAGALVGCDGPFIRMWARAANTKRAIGEVLAVPAGEAVTVTVDVQAPEWMSLDRVELYVTPTQTFGTPDKPLEDMPSPAMVFTWPAGSAQVVPGKDPETKRWHLQASFTLPEVASDGYVVAIAHGDKPMPKALFAGREVKPIAFTNPIFLDADGNGYDHPPLQKKVQAGPKSPPPPPRRRPPTLRELEQVWEAIQHH